MITAHDQSSETMEPRIVVAMVGSGGLLDALEQFFSSLSADIPMAIILVQHLDTGESDVIVDVLTRRSPLPVIEIGESTPLLTGHVYVAPQQSLVRLQEGHLRAGADQGCGTLRSAIDHALLSIAKESCWPLVGIVLSGRGSDGVLGLKGICDAGGMTMVQQPDTAKYAELPTAASVDGNVDRVLAPAEMVREIEGYLEHLQRTDASSPADSLADSVEASLPRICDELLRVTEYDFRHYKSGTLVRRVIRRMRVLRKSSVDDYIQHLCSDPEESQALFRELLISVTGFFRDPDTFATLAGSVIPKLFELRGDQEAVRVWVPGCATGEEAYTLAMMLCEELRQAR